MTNIIKAALTDLILAELRKSHLQERDGYFTDEIYADYRDEMDGRTAGEIIDSDDPEVAFGGQLYEWYHNAEWDYNRELINSVTSALPTLDDEQEEFISSFIREHVSYEYPADHFLDQDMYVNIMLDTGDRNTDFVLNSVYPCWCGRQEDRIDNRAAIVWLAKQQGYTKTQLWNALKDGDMADPKGFLQSMRVELANLPSHMSTLTFLVKMPLRQLIRLNSLLRWRDKQPGRAVYDPKDYPYSGYLILDKSTMCGLYDPWAGGGSVLEIQLEKDVKLPIKYIWLAIPDEAKGHGYQIGDVYGMCGSAWQPTLKELHAPKKYEGVI